jgi:FkbM family methyltransferase
MFLKKPLKKFLARHRRNKVVAKVGKYIELLHKGFHNLNYNPHENGESFVLDRLRQNSGIKTIFDVGANEGMWSEMASQLFPNADIYSFEIVPATHQLFKRRCRQYKNIHSYGIGLSDESGKVDVFYSPEKHFVANCVKGFSQRFEGHRFNVDVVKGDVTTGDCFCLENEINEIDFLKIDVEGLESNVLKGFENMLKQGKIKIIQFEYGMVNIAVKFLLKDFYDLLYPFGMKIGKIYPRYVDFKDYRFKDENFYGPNYLAVHQSLGSIINILKG